MNAFLFLEQHVMSEHGPVPLKSLKVGDKVVTDKFRLQPITAIGTQAPAPIPAGLTSLMSDENRALSLLAGLDCEVLVEGAWVALSNIKVGNKISACSFRAQHPHTAELKEFRECELTIDRAISITVDVDNSLFVNGIAVRCPV